MLIRVTKKRIAEILRNEPLDNFSPGLVVHTIPVPGTLRHAGAGMPMGYHTMPVKELTVACKVCAMGATLRALVDQSIEFRYLERAIDAALESEMEGLDEEEREDVSLEGEPDEELAGKRWLHAMSSFFERECVLNDVNKGEPITESIRESTVHFVLRYFPTSILVDIDGAKPAAGIEVIEDD